MTSDIVLVPRCRLLTTSLAACLTKALVHPGTPSFGISTESNDNVSAQEMKQMFYKILQVLRQPVAQSTSQVILPGAPGAPCFTGSNITRYLQEWEDQSNNWLWSAEKKVERFPQYTKSDNDWLRYFLKTLPGYLTGDWEIFKSELLEKFQDTDEKIYTLSRINKLCKAFKGRKDAKGLELFVTQFRDISKVLVGGGLMTHHAQIMTLLYTIPFEIFKSVVQAVPHLSNAVRGKDGKVFLRYADSFHVDKISNIIIE